MRTSNPMLNERTFTDMAMPRAGGQTMTAQGTATKTVMLLLLALLTAAWGWHFYDPTAKTLAPEAVAWLIGGLIGGLVLALITAFKQNWAPVTAPLYALCEGLVLGVLSVMFEAQYPGIVMQAVGLTFGTAISMLLAYKLGIIRATEKFKLGVTAATGAVAVVYLVSMVGRMVFRWDMPYLHEATPIGIAISGVIVVIAALNLVLDFDLIETAAERGAPKSYEWYGAFALMVTLVWLYLEILRLLSKLRSRN
ncbi:MAG: Bax inhibitor-1/YccA family protein [Planctomycetes bacterium]|nr:Bax inhibitor-1/YccA family protein [Planctomycetota bacterium]